MVDNDKPILRKSNAIIFTKNEFSPTQLDILNRCIAAQNTPYQEIEIDRLYSVEFFRSDIPKVKTVGYLKEQLEGLHEMKIKNLIEGAEWSSITPFPEVAEYKKGRITVVLSGRFLKVVKKTMEGYSVNLLLESFTLNGTTAKLLFDMFGSFKNRNTSRFEEDADILQELLGASKTYRGLKQQYFDKVLLPAIVQINEKTSIRVNGKYTRSAKHKKGFYTFDVYRNGKDVPATKQALPKSPRKQKIIPDGFILSAIDEVFLSETYPTAVYSSEAYDTYKRASSGGNLREWRKAHTRIKNFLPINTTAGVKWYVIPYNDAEYAEVYRQGNQ